MKMESAWLSDVVLPPARPPLPGDAEAQVVIVGGGLTGTLCGYLLSRAGMKVIVLEKKDITYSTTARTTAWLNCVVDTDLGDQIKMYTSEGAKKILTSGMEAIDLFENIIRDENIDCDFARVSNYQYVANDTEMEDLRAEYKSAQELGYDVALHDKHKLPFANSGSLEVKNQAKFHPIKFLIGLRAAAEKSGAIFYENTEVLELDGDKTVRVVTKSGTVTAQYCIIATYEPFNHPSELFGHKGMYQSYVIQANIPKNIIAPGLYEDEKNPYHYFRIDGGREFDRIQLGGEDHRKEFPILPEKNFRALESYLKKLLPDTKYEITHQWRGFILETIDGLPYIGRYSKDFSNRLVATGFSGNGMTDSAVAGVVLRDIILQKPNPYIDLYDASRPFNLYNSLSKAVDYIEEFFNGAVRNIFS